jgi:hypothetical protein
LAKGTLVVVSHISPNFLLVPRKYGNKVIFYLDAITYLI